MEQTDLHTCRTQARLAFADHVHGLIAGNCAPSAPKRSEMLTRVDPSLDRAVVLFQDVIKVLHVSMSTVLFQNTVGFELNDICFDIFLGLLILLAVAFCPPGDGAGAERVAGGLATRGSKRFQAARPPLHRAWPKEGSRWSPQWNPRHENQQPSNHKHGQRHEHYE